MERFNENSVEEEVNKEGEPISPTIRLEFFRHDDKAKLVEGQTDTTVRLTEQGRIHATEEGKTKHPHSDVALAYGSPRERSLETSMRQMLAGEDRITPDMTLEQIRELIDQNLSFGKKDIQTEKLNFVWEGKFKETAMDHYMNKKDFMRFLVEESDNLARELGDEKSLTHTRQAGNVAELVQRYLQIQPHWDRIARASPEKYKQYHNEMQRFFGSHATATESFLLRAVEKAYGREEMNKLINSMPDKNGFGFSEGYTVDLSTKDGAPAITLRYQGQTWDIPSQVVADMIEERKEFDTSIK